MSDAKFDAAFAKGDTDGSGGISKFDFQRKTLKRRHYLNLSLKNH